MNEENAEWFARRYQFSPAAFFEGLSAWNEAFAGGGSPVSCGGSRYDRRPDGFYAQREARFPKDILFADGAVRAQLCSNGNGTTVLVQDGWEARPRARGLPMRLRSRYARCARWAPLWCPRGMG